ncbi:MAG TPA: DUF308 domain-containing protein [Rugosimonospora sp.]|nr:DUF308 domain-containing protein [Rugosimonospora sp.]
MAYEPGPAGTDEPRPAGGPTAVLFSWTAQDDELFRRWWSRLALAGGVVSLVLGIILLVWPKETLVVVAVLLGIWLVIAGITGLAQAIFAPEGRSGGLRVLKALGGVLYLIAGILCIRHLFATVTFLAVLVGISWLVVGVVEVFSAFGEQASGWYRVGSFGLGLLTILAALVVLIWPTPSLVTLAWLAGIWLLVLGIAQIVMAARTLRARHPVPA